MDMSPFQDVLSPKSMRSCDEITPSASLKIANLVISHRSLALNMIFFQELDEILHLKTMHRLLIFVKNMSQHVWECNLIWHLWLLHVMMQFF